MRLRGFRITFRDIKTVALVTVLGFAGVYTYATEPEVFDVPSYFKPAATNPSCHPSYSGRCLPRYGRDIDCWDVGGAVRVIGADVYRLDGDGDGWGCE